LLHIHKSSVLLFTVLVLTAENFRLYFLLYCILLCSSARIFYSKIASPVSEFTEREYVAVKFLVSVLHILCQTTTMSETDFGSSSANPRGTKARRCPLLLLQFIS